MTAHFRLFQFMALMAGVLSLSGCTEMQLVSHWAKKVVWPGQQESRGAYKIGKPYKVDGVRYYPEENFRLVETGIASWYGPGFHNGYTANGEFFDQNQLTAAHRTLQLPSLARVTNLENGRSLVVRVNDRGPFKNGRVMDVSMRAAELLGFLNKGTARVRIEVLDKESRILASAAKRGDNTTRLTPSDLHIDQGRPVAAQPVRVASLDSYDGAMPESLRTPMITVEELGASGIPSSFTPPPRKMAAGQIHAGRFMPDPVVTTAPVLPTDIFVQAGSFAIYDNAERLAKQLVSIAPIIIESVTVDSRKMYRVKLGPIASVAGADSVLEKVISAGHGSARVVNGKKL